MKSIEMNTRQYHDNFLWYSFHIYHVCFVCVINGTKPWSALCTFAGLAPARISPWLRWCKYPSGSMIPILWISHWWCLFNTNILPRKMRDPWIYRKVYGKYEIIWRHAIHGVDSHIHRCLRKPHQIHPGKIRKKTQELFKISKIIFNDIQEIDIN